MFSATAVNTQPVRDQPAASVMPKGTELLGILGNLDERRVLNALGHRGLHEDCVLPSGAQQSAEESPFAILASLKGKA